MKCSDYETVPLCEKHHRELHDSGAQTFQDQHKLQLDLEARFLHERYQREGLPETDARTKRKERHRMTEEELVEIFKDQENGYADYPNKSIAIVRASADIYKLKQHIDGLREQLLKFISEEIGIWRTAPEVLIGQEMWRTFSDRRRSELEITLQRLKEVKP